MKTMILIAMMGAMTACATDAPEATSTSEHGLVCDPNCDPANVQYLLAAYINAGQAYGSERGPAWCRVQRDADIDGDRYYNVCSGVWGDVGGHNTQVFCNDRDGNPQCFTWGCGEGSEPHCHS